MNLNQLRFVTAVADTGSFSQAAERCKVTQPTLSNGIAQLEDELGARIFERTTRRVALTTFGQHVLPMVWGVLEAKAELEKGALTYLNPAHKLVRIGLSPLIDIGLLTTVLDPYRRRHADVEVFYKECFLGDLEERLDQEKLDIVLRPVRVDGTPNIHHVSQLFYEENLYYLPRSAGAETQSERGPVRLETIASEHFVLTHDGCGLAPATRKLFQVHELELHEYPGQALSYQVLQDWAELGIGAAILPERKIASHYRYKARVMLLGDEQRAILQYEAVWKKGNVRPPHITDLYIHFRETVPALLIGVAVKRQPKEKTIF